MKSFYTRLFLMMLPGFFWAGAGAFAQGPAQAVVQCEIIPNTVTTFKKSERSALSLWSMTEGDRNLTDRFISGIPGAEGNGLIVAGERFYREGENIGLTLQKLDGRGRVIWSDILNNRNFERVVKMVPADKGFAVLANQAGKKEGAQAWLGFFNYEGALLSEKSVKAPKGGFTATDILPLNKSTAFWLAGQVRDGADAPYAVLYRLDRKGQVQTRKAYRFGPESSMDALALGKGGVFYGAGYTIDQKNRRNGWLVKLAEDGGLMWQRPYPRGAAAGFHQVAEIAPGWILAAGYSAPYDLKAEGSQKYQAGWVAVFDDVRGDPIWERFYAEANHTLSAVDFMAHEDGQVSILMDAALPSEPAKDMEAFIRLISLNQRGDMLESAVYYNGQGVDAARLAGSGEGQRFILGQSRVPYEVMMEDPKKPKGPLIEKSALSVQGWAAAVSSPNPYEDPCAGVNP